MFHYDNANTNSNLVLMVLAAPPRSVPGKDRRRWSLPKTTDRGEAARTLDTRLIPAAVVICQYVFVDESLLLSGQALDLSLKGGLSWEVSSEWNSTHLTLTSDPVGLSVKDEVLIMVMCGNLSTYGQYDVRVVQGIHMYVS